MRQLKHLSLLLGLLLLGPSTYAQSVRFQSQAISSRGAGIANATVAVCTQPANTNTQPCSPLATLATSTSTTSGGANPLTADSFGNFFFYAAPGRYTVQIYGPAVSGQFVTPDVVLSCDPSGPCPQTGPINLTGAGSATVQTALNNLVSGQSYILPCGTYTGPALSGLANVGLVASGAPESNLLAVQYGVAGGTVASCVTLTYSSTQTLTNLYNVHIRDINIDFGSGTGRFIINTGSFNNLENVTFSGCTSPCLQIKTNGSTGAFNAAHNHFRGLKIVGNQFPAAGGIGIQIIGAGAVNAGAFATDNDFQQVEVTGTILYCVNTELNSDTNYFFDVSCNQQPASPPAGSCAIAINTLTPASDQDADGSVFFHVYKTGANGAFSNDICAGQSNGNVMLYAALANASPTVSVLGGTPTMDIQTVGLAGVAKRNIFNSNFAITGAANIGPATAAGAIVGDLTVAHTTTAGTVWFGNDAGALAWFRANSNNLQALLPSAGLVLIPAGAGLGIVEGASFGAVAGQDICYADSTIHALKCSYNNGTFFQLPQVITATSAAFATATTAGTCVQNTTAVAGATTAMVVNVSPVSTPGVGAVWSGFVSSAGNITINECAVATSAGGTIAFNIRVTP